MFCLTIAAGTLAVGIYYLMIGYQVPVGWIQVVLGLLSISLVLMWKISERRDKKRAKTADDAGEDPPNDK